MALAAGSVVDAGDPPVRRGIIVLGAAGFAEDAYRYYLSSADATGAGYRFGGNVAWPPEARSQMIGRPGDRRQHISDVPAPAASLNGD